MGSILNVAGQKFGRLTALRIVDNPPGAHNVSCKFWECICDCGKLTVRRISYLRNGTARSCGCLQKETAAERRSEYNAEQGRTLHGMTDTSEYAIWAAMRARCANKKNISFKFYGARDISVCERWRNSFIDFYNDMGPRPSLNHSIDRIDPTVGYEPSNCRWATKNTQAANRVRGPMTNIRQSKSGRFDVRISVFGVLTHVGTFDTVEQAMKARDVFRRELLSKYEDGV